jgi:phosphotransferase system enzyme I (PtsI)
MKTFKGMIANEGLSLAKAYVIKKESHTIHKTIIEDINKSLSALEQAILDVKDIILNSRDLTLKEIDETHAQIFDAQLEFLDDPDYMDDIKNMIKNEKVSASYAIQEVSKTYIEMFNQMDDGYMKDRIDDFNFVSQSLIQVLSHKKSSMVFDDQVIIVADDISPSDAIQLDKSKVLGFITQKGSLTSHVSILARKLDIPSIVGVVDILENIKVGDQILLDAYQNKIIVNPDEDIMKIYHKELSKPKKVIDYQVFKSKKILNKQGKQIEFAANIAHPNDLKEVIASHADAIGLFRTEFLYMDKKKAPTEEEQFQDYKKVLTKMHPKKVVIRTLDIGGDKVLDYLHMDIEENPFLGKRAIRLCLDNKPLFKTQIKALLRAGVYGNLHIMIPMISTIDELLETKALIDICKQELKDKHITYSDDYKLGMMMEVPAACLMADEFSKEVDFFSIGTNDLIQYTFAADRMNSQVSYLYKPDSKAIISLIKMVINSARKEGIWVGVCGEMAGQENYARKLIDLGIDELSMNASSILKLKSKL